MKIVDGGKLRFDGAEVMNFAPRVHDAVCNIRGCCGWSLADTVAVHGIFATVLDRPHAGPPKGGTPNDKKAKRDVFCFASSRLISAYLGLSRLAVGGGTKRNGGTACRGIGVGKNELEPAQSMLEGLRGPPLPAFARDCPALPAFLRRGLSTKTNESPTIRSPGRSWLVGSRGERYEGRTHGD